MAALWRLSQVRTREPRLFRDRLGIDHLRDFEILSRYRLDRPSVTALTALLEEELTKPTKRSHAIDAEIQVLIGLRFLAKGAFYSELADLHGVSKSSVCLIIDSFLDAVNNKLDNIRFPVEEVSDIKLNFYKKCGLPKIVGAVDGTLIPIQAPAEDEATYVCRKGFHAINMQAVVDSNMRFLDIVARWPGSQHDAFIFKNSGIKTYLERSNIGYLLGDSGYPLRHYLTTPILSPTTHAEEEYNSRHAQGRMVVEKAFGVLKSRFRCLHKSGGTLPFKPRKCCRTAEACVRLHNFCMDRQVPLLAEPVEEESAEDSAITCLPIEQTGQDRRRSLIRLFQ